MNERKLRGGDTNAEKNRSSCREKEEGPSEEETQQEKEKTIGAKPRRAESVAIRQGKATPEPESYALSV